MRLLAKENVPGEVVGALQREGHDVIWIRTECPGLSEGEVLSKALTEARVLLTFDKDFGELAVRRGLPAPCGVILFRIGLKSPSWASRAVTAAIKSRSDWAGHFSVVEENRIRMRPLPRSGETGLS